MKIPMLAGAWLLGRPRGSDKLRTCRLKGSATPPPSPVFKLVRGSMSVRISVRPWGRSTTVPRRSPTTPDVFVTVLPMLSLPSIVTDVNKPLGRKRSEFQFGDRRLRGRIQSSTRIFRGGRRKPISVSTGCTETAFASAPLHRLPGSGGRKRRRAMSITSSRNWLFHCARKTRILRRSPNLLVYGTGGVRRHQPAPTRLNISRGIFPGNLRGHRNIHLLGERKRVRCMVGGTGVGMDEQLAF